MKSEAASDGSVVILGRINRVRRKAVELVEGQPPKPPKPHRRRPLRVARTLALAHVFRELVDAGVVRDQAELAAVTGFTRARITQMMDLTLLAPSIQEEILLAEESCGVTTIAERRLREVVSCVEWNAQRTRWSHIAREVLGRNGSGDRQAGSVFSE